MRKRVATDSHKILPLSTNSKITSLSQQPQQPQTLEQFIESNKTQYAIQKGTLASNEYLAIITPYYNQIISLQKQLKETQSKLPKKERVKIIKKPEGKK